MNHIYNYIKHGDFLNLGKELPDKSINLIMADPPYYKVKGDFDFIWKSFDDYLKDVEKWVIECKRVLVDNGCLFWWGHAKKIAYSQIILDKYFHLGNSLVWEKTDCQTKKNDFNQSRCFAPVTERCLFYSNDILKTGLQEIYSFPNCFISIKKYMRDERKKMMESYKFKTIEQFNIYIRKITNTSSVVDRHYFADSQYCFPTKEIYKKLQTTRFFKRPYKDLRKEYEDLIKEYGDLMKKYEDSRRPFNNVFKFTDVIKAAQEVNISKKYDHDTIKPITLISKFIRITTKENDIVLDPFLGSGTTVISCIRSNRKYIGFEKEYKYIQMVQSRIDKELEQPEIFKKEEIQKSIYKEIDIL